MEVTEHTVLGPNTGLIATASWWRQLDSPCGFWSHSITLALTLTPMCPLSSHLTSLHQLPKDLEQI